MKYYVGGYYGCQFSLGQSIDYQNSDNGRGYQGSWDVQYPFHEIHVKYGDSLIFTRRYGSATYDDLYLVPEEVYESCNFSSPYNLTNPYVEMDNTSMLWLADFEDIWCDPGNDELPSECQYEFLIEDWSNYEVTEEEDLFGQLITADTLYFTSSYYWDNDNIWRQSCKGGLKVKVIIDGYRKLMPLKKSSDAWRDIADQDIVEAMDASIGHISRQLILQQFNDEQRIRSEGIYTILVYFKHILHTTNNTKR